MKFAFGCQSGVGKKTACKYLQGNFGGSVLHFSDPLNDILGYAQSTCNFDKKKDPKFLEYIGEWSRQQNPNVWINLLLKKIDEIKRDPLALKKNISNIYIADVCFKNEVNALKEKGFVCILLSRKRNSSVEDVGDGFTSRWDEIVYNNGTIEEFYLQLDHLVKKYSV